MTLWQITSPTQSLQSAKRRSYCFTPAELNSSHLIPHQLAIRHQLVLALNLSSISRLRLTIRRPKTIWVLRSISMVERAGRLWKSTQPAKARDRSQQIHDKQDSNFIRYQSISCPIYHFIEKLRRFCGQRTLKWSLCTCLYAARKSSHLGPSRSALEASAKASIGRFVSIKIFISPDPKSWPSMAAYLPRAEPTCSSIKISASKSAFEFPGHCKTRRYCTYFNQSVWGRSKTFRYLNPNIEGLSFFWPDGQSLVKSTFEG